MPPTRSPIRLTPAKPLPDAHTGIECSSAETKPVVLPEMAQLLPPLTGEQLAALEADLLANGCYSPIIVNEDMVIVDGHHRYELCVKHGLPYKMAVFSAIADILERMLPVEADITEEHDDD